MSVIADFTVPYTEFALGRVLEIESGIGVRLESMIPTGEAVMPYFWVTTDDADPVRATLSEDPLTRHVEIVDRVDEEILFRVEWDPDIDGLIDVLLNTEAVVLEAVGTGDSWSFELRFRDYDALSEFYQRCVGKGIDITLGKVHDPVEGTGAGSYGLTTEQHETLLTALEAGYFDVPRRTTLVDLGERLGISDSAVSQRLRRGLARLVAATLGESTEPGGPLPEANEE
jgi:predicted DNA binding protein